MHKALLEKNALEATMWHTIQAAGLQVCPLHWAK
jgi:hypothetical protein